MVNEFKLTMHHRSFCTPKPDADLCMRVDLKTRQKNCGKIRTSTGPRAAGAFGPLGRRAAGPGRWAVSGRGPWAAGPRACFWNQSHSFLRFSINDCCSPSPGEDRMISITIIKLSFLLQLHAIFFETGAKMSVGNHLTFLLLRFFFSN